MQFSSQQNVVIPAALQQAVVLPAREEKFLGKLIPSGPGAWGYDYGFAYSSHQGRNQVDSDHRVKNCRQHHCQSSGESVERVS
ncbi:hypothetical protein MBH78_10565 [Oceanimonas sp. NS1]|nr:hypothetical protein [Oceanimonas sp. NS1]